MTNVSKADKKAKSSDNTLLTIIKLLDRNQPYEEFDHLDDHTLIISKNFEEIISKIQGSLIGLAIGDALGAPVEFRPYSFLQANPVSDMQEGGTWGLKVGQWTDDTSMTLCLAASLIVKGHFDPYDQFDRYSRWLNNGYMSSTGTCFDIGQATRQAINEFERCRKKALKQVEADGNNSENSFYSDLIREKYLEMHGDLEHGAKDSAGNGALMRLAPIPAFFHVSYSDVEKYIDTATKLTHGDQRAVDACRFYAGLIWHAMHGETKENLLDADFYKKKLCITLGDDVKKIAKGSYKNKPKGYEDGIRGKGFVLDSLEAALWSFYNDEDSFETGVLLAVNLGDDTDTTAAIYGQLAGATYGIKSIPEKWRKKLFQANFIMTIAECLYVRGSQKPNNQRSDWSDNGDSSQQSSSEAGANNAQNDKKTNNKPDSSGKDSSPRTQESSDKNQSNNSNNSRPNSNSGNAPGAKPSGGASSKSDNSRPNSNSGNAPGAKHSGGASSKSDNSRPNSNSGNAPGAKPSGGASSKSDNSRPNSNSGNAPGAKHSGGASNKPGDNSNKLINENK